MVKELLFSNSNHNKDHLENIILDNLNTAIFLFDDTHVLYYVNPAGEALLEMSSTSMIGRHIEQIIKCSSESSRSHLIHLLASHGPITQRGIFISLWNAIKVTVDCSAVPVPINKDQFHLLLEMQRVDRHLRITKEDQLISQQKTAVTVIRNLAHEINNPLGGLRGAAQLLQQELTDPTKIEYTQVIIAEADRLQALVTRLLGPNKKPAMIRVNIHQLLERVRQLILAESRHAINVRRDYDPSIPELLGDPDQLIQALLNIARNAARAINEDGYILLGTRVLRQFTIINKRHPLVLQIEIHDDGPGISEELQEKIFLPMISGYQGGIGIGLSIAQSLINQHGGLIEFTSRPGDTTFSILIPLELDNA